MPRKPGRPSKLTEDRTKRITDAIQIGAYPEHAARAAGIAPSTYYDWMAKGEEGYEGFAEFSEAVKEAKAQAEINDLAVITKAARDGHWQAAAWKRERSDPEHWGRRERVEHTGKGGGPVTVADLTDPEVRRLANELLARSASGDN